jgi:hypothetical protein
MKRKPNIIEAIKNPKLFGSLFNSLDSWLAWIVWLKAVFGLAMDSAELELYRKCTGRTEPPNDGVKEAYAIVGRRGGKSRIVAFAAAFIACFHDFRRYLAPGERGMVLILARDREQAKVVFNYIGGILNGIPALKQMVTAWRADEIELNNGIIIAVKASDYRAVRGVTIVCCICDEVAFWDSQGVNPDKEIFQALRPAMVTIPDAKLLVISSPYAKFGVLFEAHRNNYGRDDAPVLVWQAPTTVMNPSIPAEFIQDQIDQDPEAGRSEWLAQFREDIEAAFSLEIIEACVIHGRVELLPAERISYLAFCDPSGGRHDQFTLSISHRADDKAIIDLVRAWKPPFDPSEVVKECAEALKPYRVKTIIGDAYAGEWPREQFRKHGITYQLSDKNRSQLYLDLIPVVCSKRVELPDNRKLIDELRRLERRRGRSGKDSIDHPANGHDDMANAVAGAVNMAIAKPPVNSSAIPYGVGRGTNWLIGSSTWTQTAPGGSTFGPVPDEQRPYPLPRVENLAPQPKPVIYDKGEANYQEWLNENNMVEVDTDDYVSQTMPRRVPSID